MYKVAIREDIDETKPPAPWRSNLVEHELKCDQLTVIVGLDWGMSLHPTDHLKYLRDALVKICIDRGIE